MSIEKSQIKFAKSEQTGEIIGFVSRHSKTKQLKGVRENSTFGKKICLLSENLKGTIQTNILYRVELKAMHQRNGYVVVSATPMLFKAHIETVIVPESIYQIRITFGNKTVYFDPLRGQSPSSKTVEGVVEVLAARKDIEDLETVIEEFRKQAASVVQQMEKDTIVNI
jgi:protein involved in ribonucleotide reduction